MTSQTSYTEFLTDPLGAHNDGCESVVGAI